MVYCSLREYDLDPGEWTRNEARLRALASDLAELPDVSDVFRKPPAQDLDLIASLLSDEKLDYFQSIAARIYGELPQGTPFNYLFADKGIHHTEWKEAFEREAQRRAAGSQLISAAKQLEIAPLVNKYTAADGLPAPRAESKFLQLVSCRFPHLDTMPQGLRNDVASVLKRGLSASIEEAISLFETYRGISSAPESRGALVQSGFPSRLQLALSAVAAPSDLIRIYHELKSSHQAIMVHIDKAIAQAETFKTDVAELRGEYQRLVALLPNYPSWTSPVVALLEDLQYILQDRPWGTPPAPSSVTPELKLRRYQVELEKELQNVARLVNEAKSNIPKPHNPEPDRSLTLLNPEPDPFNRESKGLSIGRLRPNSAPWKPKVPKPPWESWESWEPKVPKPWEPKVPIPSLKVKIEPLKPP